MDFLGKLKESAGAPLKATLEACPPKLLNVESICPPCASADDKCTCVERASFTWNFCMKKAAR